MDSVLLISSTEKSTAVLTEMLSQNYYKEIAVVHNCGEARRLLMDRDFDLCIINTPLADEFGESFACGIVSKGITQVILIVKSELFDSISEKVEDLGVFTISKPISKGVFWGVLKLANAAYRKMSLLQNENQKLLKKIEDIRMVDRAKCILIEYMRITETEAHKYIEKHAMDLRISKKEVAQSIIKTYEN